MSSIISTMEYYNDWPNEYPYFIPMVNNAMANLASKSLLYSNSNYSKKERLSRSDLPSILNSLVQTGDRLDIFHDEKIESGDKLDYVIHSLFSSQFWYNRNITKEKIGLLYSLYQEIPTEFRDELKEIYGEHFIDIPDLLSTDIGISISKYLISCVYLVYIHHKVLYDKYLEPSEEAKEYIRLFESDEDSQNGIRQELILNILENSISYYPLFGFSKQPSFLSSFSLTQLLGFLSEPEIDAFLRLTSKNISELRKINSETWHQKGHISQRLSPFERYPILKLDFPCYIIPNLRFFELGITELIRFELQQLFLEDNNFHEVMGSIQELFLIKLLKQLDSPEFIVIKERSYVRNKSEYKGPDVIIIDKGRPILVESKAKQLLLDTRLKPDLDILNKNIKPVISALVKLNEEKFEDLYDNEIYSDIQDKLIERESVQPLFVGVMGEGPIAFQEQVSKLKKQKKDHDLNQIKYPTVFIDVFNFYRAVEMSKTNDTSLYEILEKYWLTGSSLEPKSSASDDFEGLKYNLEKSYSKERFDLMMDEIFS
ncbi:MAG: hypothetical protein JJ958_12185 [Balneola sp.]|nr:hypothetical protein [Balneola sp.]